MFEVMATLAVLVIGGIFLTFVAVAGLVFASLIKLIFFPITLAFDLLKWIVLIVVVPLILLVVIPLILLIVVPALLAVMLPIILGLVVLAVPLLVVGVVAHAL